jgi:hypothetical protein
VGLHSAYELARRELELLLTLERDPPAYLAGQLGAVPDAANGRSSWREAMRLIERYRAEHNVNDPTAPLGPRPTDATADHAWLKALERVEALRVEIHRAVATRERQAPTELPRMGAAPLQGLSSHGHPRGASRLFDG